MTADEGTHPQGPAQRDELGARLQAALGDGYVVEGELGCGGFAVVYLVRDLSLKRKLAAKVLNPDVIASHSALERFRREAETIAQLSHPHIVPLHFVGQKDDLVYLIMAAIEGGSLADRLKREPQLPIEDAARIFAEVASALAFAHKRGVVHRDIKPQNVLLEAESGRALVTDFGIARTAEGGTLTATGMVVGTPAYLSPEQVTGESSDHRGDIYALGVMAYEMLAGRQPFTGSTPTAVMMKRLAGPPESLRKIRPDVPSQLADLVDACLATDPKQRIANARDIVRALTGHSPVSGGHTTRTGLRVRTPQRANRLTWMVVGAIAAVVVAVTVFDNFRPRSEPSSPVASLDSTLAAIAGGTYTIGSNEGPEVVRPAHPVQLAPFALERHEVTVGEYQRFMDARGVPAPWTKRPGDNLPVTGVQYAEAVNYCAWRYPDGGRLPTEEEWEAAARGADGRLYPWGNAWTAGAANTQGAGRDAPVAVGSFAAGRTRDGLDDMIGNVWEWTASPYRPYTGSGASTGLYVIRGAAYNSYDRIATAVFRSGFSPAARRQDLSRTGFRCAMNAPATAAR